MKRFMIIAAVIAISLYLIVLALLYVYQRRVMYFPPKVYLTPAAVGLEALERDFTNGDRQGVQGVTAWWIPPQDNKPVIMFFHGNASAVYSNQDIYRDLSEAGFGVWGVGYVGYPSNVKSESPTQAAIIKQAEMQYDYVVKEAGILPDRIVFYGTSLGAAVAAQLAARRKPAMNSMTDMAGLHAPFIPVSLLMKDSYQSNLALGGLNVPLVWMHGTADGVVPFAQGKRLYEGYDGPKTAKVFEGGLHTNLWGLGGREFIISMLEAY